jgi:hypothetical protein
VKIPRAGREIRSFVIASESFMTEFEKGFEYSEGR